MSERNITLVVSLSHHELGLVFRPFGGLRVVPSTVEGRQAQDERKGGHE